MHLKTVLNFKTTMFFFSLGRTELNLTGSNSSQRDIGCVFFHELLSQSVFRGSLQMTPQRANDALVHKHVGVSF